MGGIRKVEVMKDIIIRSDEHSGFLRYEAVSKAIEFEDLHMKDRKEGSHHGVLWVKCVSNSEWQFYAYHTKTAIIVRVDKRSK